MGISPELKDMFPEEERRLNEIQQKILKVPGVRRDLDSLTREGASESRVLQLLALTVFDQSKRWRRVINQKREALRSHARRLLAVTEEGERLAEDPRCGGHFWLALFGLISWDEMSWPPKQTSNAPLGIMMRKLAEHKQNKAKLLGNIARVLAAHERRAGIVALCYYVRRSTGHNHDGEVSRLLVDAHEAVGLPLKNPYNPLQLRQLRKRHMRSVVRLLRQPQQPR